MTAHISLTYFVDFAASVGTPKVTVVRNAITAAGTEYEPVFDYWFPLRQAIRQTHQRELPKTTLDRLVGTIPPAKSQNYARYIRSYKRWWGRKKIRWLGAPRRQWTSSGVTVSVNPELGLEIDGERWIIKLYFRAAGLTKRRADVALRLLERSYGPRDCDRVGILDVGSGRLFTPTVPRGDLDPLLDAELAAFSSLWSALGGP